jgi:hypothetical protein
MLKVSLIFAGFLGVALVASTPLRAQVEPSASGGSDSGDDSSMSTPPPVSGTPYGSDEAKSNSVGASVGVSGAYVNNILPNETQTPVNDATISIYPSVSLRRSTGRQSENISYSPSFTFYEPTSVLNTVGQSASLGAQFRLSPHISLNLNDSFLRTSDVYNESYPFSNPVTGSTQASAPVIIAPYAGQMVESATGNLSYQFARNSMIGGGGSYTSYTLLDQNNAGGLYSSTGEGGDLYYSRRLTREQYIGVSDGYSRSVASNSTSQYESQLNSLVPFYTYYFNPQFSVSVSAGFIYIFPSGPFSTLSSPWQPTYGASMGLQRKRTNFAANFSHSTVTGWGLLYVYNSTNVSGSAGVRLSKNWNAGVSASYSDVSSFVSSAVTGLTTGNSTYAQVAFSHQLRENLALTFGYQLIHEDYGAIQAISADPNSNRVYATIVYQLQRPLGR